MDFEWGWINGSLHPRPRQWVQRQARESPQFGEAESVHHPVLSSTKMHFVHNIKWHKIRLPYAYSLLQFIMFNMKISLLQLQHLLLRLSVLRSEGLSGWILPRLKVRHDNLRIPIHVIHGAQREKKKKLTDLAHIERHLENLNDVKSSIYRWIFPYKPSVFGDFPFWFCHNLSTAGPWAENPGGKIPHWHANKQLGDAVTLFHWLRIEQIPSQKRQNTTVSRKILGDE